MFNVSPVAVAFPIVLRMDSERCANCGGHIPLGQDTGLYDCPTPGCDGIGFRPPTPRARRWLGPRADQLGPRVVERGESVRRTGNSMMQAGCAMILLAPVLLVVMVFIASSCDGST